MQSAVRATHWPNSVTREMILPGAGSPKRSRDSQPIFAEMRFIRLTDNWSQSERDPGLWGGDAFDHRIFRQYQLNWAQSVTLDFWFRGGKTSPGAGRAFAEILSRPHSLAKLEIESLREVLGVAGVELGLGVPSAVVNIESAEVGSLKGRAVLAVRWQHRKMKRQFLSVYIDADGDGRTVREIHFSTPTENFAQHVHLAHEALRSIQWAEACPPPMFSYQQPFSA